MRLIDADAIVFTHAIARSIDDGHNWNELCVTKDEIDDMPSAELERTAKVETVEKPNVFKCGECGQYFHSTAWGSPVEYCSRCGCRLDWNEDIPMEYFENGGI